MRSRRGRDEREERALSLLASDCLRRGKNDGEKTERGGRWSSFFFFCFVHFFPSATPTRDPLQSPSSLSRSRARRESQSHAAAAERRHHRPAPALAREQGERVLAVVRSWSLSLFPSPAFLSQPPALPKKNSSSSPMLSPCPWPRPLPL